MNSLFDTLTNEINQSGCYQRTLDLVMVEWPEIYGKALVNEIKERYNNPKRFHPLIINNKYLTSNSLINSHK